MSKAHHCPGCGVLLDFYDRYPWHFCQNCLDLAEDWEGRRLVFCNASFSGGLRWAYVDDPETSSDAHLRVACLISRRPALVQEARFGGVVAQPLTPEFIDPIEGLLDLTKPSLPQTASKPQFVLPADWYDYVVPKGVFTHLPGIYEWHIEGAGTYIGKYTSVDRPTREYARNVTRLINGHKYRLSNADGFRRIHRELAKAVTDGRRIVLTILENVERDDLNQRERELIVERGTLNGAATVS